MINNKNSSYVHKQIYNFNIFVKEYKVKDISIKEFFVTIIIKFCLCNFNGVFTIGITLQVRWRLKSLLSSAYE